MNFHPPKNHIPTDDADLYDANYFNAYYSNDQRRALMYRQEYQRILAHKPIIGSVLDVGCGVGGLMEIFDDRWRKYGIEPSEFASEKAENKGVQIMRSINTIESASMDVIIFRGTLQHINFPMQTLAQAARILKPGGLMVILATPDTDSLIYKIWGQLPALDAPRNWVIFGGRMLVNILKRFEYSEIEVIHPYWKTPYARPLHDFGNFLLSLFLGWRPFAFPGNMLEIYAVKERIT